MLTSVRSEVAMVGQITMRTDAGWLDANGFVDVMTVIAAPTSTNPPGGAFATKFYINLHSGLRLPLLVAFIVLPAFSTQIDG